MVSTMRLLSLLLLVVTGLSLLAPVVIAHPLPDTEGTASFVTLNVCHATDSGTGGSLDIPCLYESAGTLVRTEGGSPYCPPDSPSKFLLIAFQDERPPRV
ncbi:MAG: hypothetical protein K8I29_03860 [Alphaproteobacteria bacterium]|uniref:Uncharacterized protein n=1 Tax=Candidatus Nitrobium versatile TaxID=2884831 RepID=A0A953JAY6_9BACT|nr:hypothetical protein [Candidatus Nitrobium versatile]